MQWCSTTWPGIIMSNGAHRTIWIFPSVCETGTLLAAHYSVYQVSSAHMEEPPRMIPGLHNAVSCPKSANCGWLSHPWPKCRFFHSHFMYLPLFILLERFSSRLVRSEGWNGSFWPEKVQCLTPPHLPLQSPYTATDYDKCSNLKTTQCNLLLPPNENQNWSWFWKIIL